MRRSTGTPEVRPGQAQAAVRAGDADRSPRTRPYIWLHHDAEVKVWGEHVKGFEHISDGMIRVKGVSLEKK